MTQSGTIPPQAFALVAFFSGIVSGVFLKGVAPDLSGEAIALRTLVAFAILATAIVVWPQHATVRFGRIGVLRAVLDAIAGLTFALAIFNLPLGLLASILATLPIVSVTLSALILSEPLSKRTTYALGLAFAGTLLILKPGLSFSALGITLALVSTLSYALRDIATRQLPADIDPRKVVMLALAFVTFASLGLAPVQGLGVPSPREGVLIVMAGVTFLGATFLIVLALRTGTVNQIAPLRYTSVFWALLFDALIWGYVPDAFGWCGIAMILAAGILHQTQPRQDETST